MMQSLQAHMTTLHHVSSGAMTCGNRQLHVFPDAPNELQLHREAISRAASSCSGTPAHSRSSVVQHSSSTKCLHLCCSGRERNHSPFQTPRATLSSSYMTQTLRGPSLLGLSSAFGTFPVTRGLSHPSINIQTHADVVQNLTNPQTPIHFPNTPAGQPQYHTAFSSLTPSGSSTSMSMVHNKTQQSSVRQNDPIGSSSVQHSPERARSLLGHPSERDCSLHHERKDPIIAKNSLLKLQD